MLRQRLSERVGVSCIPLASGTHALMTAIAAVKDSYRGSHALLPSFTFSAVLQSLTWNNLRPVFVDVEPEGFHMSPAALEEALSEGGDRIGVVVACSCFGTPPPSSIRRAWEDLCRAAGVPLVIDSAAGFGGSGEDRRPIGTQGDVEIVSFHATKTFAIGEGGAAFSRSPEVIESIHRLANFDFDEDRESQSALGLNAKMDELHAAVALATLDGLDDILRRRTAAARKLADLIGPPFVVQKGFAGGPAQFVPMLAPDQRTRDAVLTAAKDIVEIRTYYKPLHLMKGFSHIDRPYSLRVTEDVACRALSLPMANDLTAPELDLIAETVISVL